MGFGSGHAHLDDPSNDYRIHLKIANINSSHHDIVKKSQRVRSMKSICRIYRTHISGELGIHSLASQWVVQHMQCEMMLWWNNHFLVINEIVYVSLFIIK